MDLRSIQRYMSNLSEDSSDGPALVRVAPEAIYHFRERPMSNDQAETLPAGDERWHLVTATVPNTILLMPFLLSMGPWIEVLAPADVRAEAAKRIGGMWAHYAGDQAA